MKATKATVSIGHIQIEGYLTEQGLFGMSLSELGLISGCAADRQHGASSLTRKMKSKQALTRFPQGFQTHPVSVSGVKVVIVDIDQVSMVLRVVGTPQSEDLLDLFVSLSLRKLFSDAFGQKFESEEMQAWLLIRTQGIEKRNEWTAGIKAYGETHEVSDNWKKFVYCNVSDRLNQALTGHKAKYWCDLLECIPSTLRDHWEPSHLSNVEAIERHALVLLNKGAEPKDALEAAIEFFAFPVNETPHRTISKAAQYKRDRRAKGLVN